MVKTFVPDQLLAEWFIKYFLSSITKDVAKGGFVTEEQVISRAQYLDLIYPSLACSMIRFQMHLDQLLLFHQLHPVRTLMPVMV